MERLRSSARLELLARVTRALAEASSDPRVLLDTVTKEIAEAMDAFCGLSRLSDVGDRLDLVSRATPEARPISPALAALVDEPVPLDAPAVVARAMRERSTVHLEEVTEERNRARYPDELRRAVLGEAHLRAMLAIPVQARGTVLGVLSLFRYGLGAEGFSADDVQFVEHLAVQAALAMTSARLVTGAREQARRLQLLSDLTREFAATMSSTRALLGLIVRRIGDTIGDSCLIRLVDESGDMDALAAMYARRPELQPLCEEVVVELAATRYLGMTGEVLASGQPVLIPSAEFSAIAPPPPPRLRELLERLAARSLIAVPLRLAGKPIAVLVLTRGPDTAPFDVEDLELVEDLAAHATVAITNARLLESGARTTLRLRALTDAAARFAADVGDPRRLLETLATHLSEQIGGLCVIRLRAEDGATEAPAVVVHPIPEVVARTKTGSGPLRRDSIVEQLLTTGEPVLLSPTEPRVHTDTAAAGTHNLIGIPLRAGTEVIGALTLTRGTAEPYTRADLVFAQDLAGHAALAIRNSRLLASVQHELAERVRAQDALVKSQEQLRHAQKLEAVGRLAGGIAHDFNNLLSVVLSSCEFLSEEIPPSSLMHEDVDQIRSSGERAAALTRQLLAFSRQSRMEPVVLDLNEQVHDVRKLLRRVVGENISVTTKLASDLGAVKADPSNIEQVLMNLAINARDAMPRGGTLTFETSNVEIDRAFAESHIGITPGPHVRLAVTDTGEGMSPETLARIFEPFFTTKPRGKGTGLGLSTVFGIVTQNGGSIWAQSELGKGTTFEVYLPRYDETVDRAAPRRELANLDGKETILVVEDEDAVRATVREILSRRGYRVIETSNGQEALAAYARTPDEIDLVLTDVVMPGIGGRELAERLTAQRPDLKILFMSGYTDDAILQHHFALGTELLHKPLSPEPVLRRVRAVLDAR